MKIIHHDGFTEDELYSFKPTVLDNLLNSMKYVLTGMGLLRINLESNKNQVNHPLFYIFFFWFKVLKKMPVSGFEPGTTGLLDQLSTN